GDLTGPQDHLRHTRPVLRERRDAAVAAFRAIGWEAAAPAATLYLWVPIPGRKPALAFCQDLVKTTGVALAPGSGFGSAGEGYVRLALVQPPAILRAAIAAIGKFQ
ncbi:MAG TPA: succinyldiaminopimelate aminotransferase, partial [Cyanobacteria bacterium UBA8156]|nr:succinyldiaminopimelate aminotransferase [Cyanobacteria bacterium UBA8156]